MTTIEITPKIKEAIIEQLCFEREGELFISLGNSRLDFSKTYKVLGFTKKTIKMAWQNGRDWVNQVAKIENRHDYIAVYAEGWSYIEHLRGVEQ